MAATKAEATGTGGESFAAKKLNDVLASICGDYKPRKKADMSEGIDRQWARGLLVVLLLALLVGLFWRLFTQSGMIYYTTRVYAKDFATFRDPFFDFSPGPGGQQQIVGFQSRFHGKNMIKVACPCQEEVVSWSNFTDFFTYTPGGGQGDHEGGNWNVNRSVLTNGKDFCQDLVQRLGKQNPDITPSASPDPTLPLAPPPDPTVLLAPPEAGDPNSYRLPQMTDLRGTSSQGSLSDLSPAVTSSQERLSDFSLACESVFPYILNKAPRGSLADNPASLKQSCSFRYANNSDECFSAYQQMGSSWLLNSEVLNVTVVNQVLALYERRLLLVSYGSGAGVLGQAYDDLSNAFYSTLLQHIVTSGTDVLENACTELDSSYFGQPVTAVGLRVNWPAYFLACRPAYCDVLEQKSQRRRAYDVIVALGGFLSIAMFSLQQLAWPLVCFALFTKWSRLSPLVIPLPSPPLPQLAIACAHKPPLHDEST